VGEVGRALLERPVLHRSRDLVGQRDVDGGAARERRLELLIHGLGQALALHGGAEDVGAEDLVDGAGQVDGAQR
jgi:hypothetical protein